MQVVSVSIVRFGVNSNEKNKVTTGEFGIKNIFFPSFLPTLISFLLIAFLPFHLILFSGMLNLQSKVF